MPNFIYSDDIPFPTNNPSVDQPNMRTNTNSIDSLIGIDHFSFNNNFGGTHQMVQIRNQDGTINGVRPPTLQGNGWETIYSSATEGVGELWFVRGAGGAPGSKGIQLTGPGTPIALSKGYTFLPGGILIQWGKNTTSLSSGSTIGSETFAIPFANGSFVVTGNPLMNYSPSGNRPASQGSLNIRASSLGNTTGFDWQFYTNSSEYKGFTWMAIGN